MAWLGQCAGTLPIMISTTVFFNIIFGSCLLFIVIAEDIANDVAAFNNTIQTLKNRDGDRAKVMGHFCDIVQQYADVNQ